MNEPDENFAAMAARLGRYNMRVETVTQGPADIKRLEATLGTK